MPHCLLLEPVSLIAEDLSAMIREVRPDARIEVAGTAEEAEAIARRLTRVDIAFLSLPPSQIVGSPLEDVLRRAGAAVVCVGYEPEARQMCVRSLERPYTSEAIRRELGALGGAMEV